MLIHLPTEASTTPKSSAAIQNRNDAGKDLADHFEVTLQSVDLWRRHDSVADRSHTPHRLTTMVTPAHVAVEMELRKTLLVLLNDLLEVARERLTPFVTRLRLDLSPRSQGDGSPGDLTAKAAKPKHRAFKLYEPECLHVDVKYLLHVVEEVGRRRIFVAIDQATRWAFVGVFLATTAATAQRFVSDLERACRQPIRTILTDNGKKFTDRSLGLHKLSAPNSPNSSLCAALGLFFGRIKDIRTWSRLYAGQSG